MFVNYGIHMATYSKFVLFMGECEGRKKSVAKKGLCYYVTTITTTTTDF